MFDVHEAEAGGSAGDYGAELTVTETVNRATGERERTGEIYADAVPGVGPVGSLSNTTAGAGIRASEDQRLAPGVRVSGEATAQANVALLSAETVRDALPGTRTGDFGDTAPPELRAGRPWSSLDPARVGELRRLDWSEVEWAHRLDAQRRRRER